MRPRHISLVPITLAVAASVAACSMQGSSEATPAPATETTSASAATTGATTASTDAAMSAETASQEPLTVSDSPSGSTDTLCVGDDYTQVGEYCVYPSKVKWLPSAVLPVDPSTLDWTDPDEVAKAYAITANTWDSREDKSGAYADRRAAIFTEQGRTTPDTTDPDQARGQAEFTTTWQQDSYATTTINSVTTESMTGDPQQEDGSWQRVVDYTRTVHTRNDNKTPYVMEGFLFVTLNLDSQTGQWLITQATPAQEVSLND